MVEPVQTRGLGLRVFAEPRVEPKNIFAGKMFGLHRAIAAERLTTTKTYPAATSQMTSRSPWSLRASAVRR